MHLVPIAQHQTFPLVRNVVMCVREIPSTLVPSSSPLTLQQAPHNHTLWMNILDRHRTLRGDDLCNIPPKLTPKSGPASQPRASTKEQSFAPGFSHVRTDKRICTPVLERRTTTQPRKRAMCSEPGKQPERGCCCWMV